MNIPEFSDHCLKKLSLLNNLESLLIDQCENITGKYL